MNPFLLLVVAYLLGATPTSYWVGRGVYGVNLREHGSGNLGATNTFRVLGWKAALPVVLVDIGKGWLPVWLFTRIDAPAAAWSWALAYGAAAIVGHVFSIWVGFKGGKGVATSAGVFLALAPWAVLVCLGVFVGAVATTRIVSLGSLLAAILLPLGVFVLPHTAPPEADAVLLGFTLALSAFVIWAHRSNIRRLLKGEENRFGSEASDGRDGGNGGAGDAGPGDRAAGPSASGAAGGTGTP